MIPSSSRRIPFFSYPFVFLSMAEHLLEVFQDVGRRGAFILQRDLEQFENNLANFLGVKYAIGVGNATDGLHFSLRAAGIGPGDEVILCTHTMIATAAAIHFSGATPIPVDCGRDHLIDPVAVEIAVTPRTKAIVPTHLNGRTCDMDSLRAIAERHALLIIEDAAQALGSKFKGRNAGTFGLAAAISFFPAKVLGCLGDGGVVITNDDAVAERVRQLRDHGRNPSGQIVSWGLNSRLDNLQAAILDFQLRDYQSVVCRRRTIASLYTSLLSDLQEVVLPPPPDSDPDHFDIFQNYEIEADRRDELRPYLESNGVGTLIQWNGQAVHQLKALGFTQELQRTDDLFTRMFLLPLNMSLTDDEIGYICDCIHRFYRG